MLKDKLLSLVKNYKLVIRNISLQQEIINNTHWLDDSCSLSQRIYHIINELFFIPVCQNCCVKPVKYYSLKIGYNNYCSAKCSSTHFKVKETRKKTNIEKYGFEHYVQTKEFKDKAQETNLERYGVKHALQNENLKNKAKRTTLERHGVEIAFHSEVFKEKAKQTNIEKYGVEYISQTKEFKEKVKKTNNDRYGVDCSLHYEEIKLKVKKTNLIKYGTEFPTKNEEIKNKTRKTNFERYGVVHVSQSESSKQKAKETCLLKYGIENHTQKHNITGFNLLNNYEWLKNIYEEKSVDEISKLIDVSTTVIHKKLRSFNIPVKKSLYSAGEKEISDWLKSISNYELVLNDRNIIKPKELDIYIPEKNLAIEFNGAHWHSSVYKDSNFHLQKTNLCEANGVQLLHIFESEWIEKQEICKSVILSKLGLIQNKIYARNTEIREISIKEGYDFFNDNHLQGGLFIGEHIGLYYNNELVCCISYGKSRFEKDTLEIYRFANKLNTTVVGGFQKLLKLLPKPIISYANRRWSNGNLYEKCGFKFIKNTKKNYYYTDGYVLLSRHQFQKHKLKNMKFYDEKLTEKEIMKLNGYNIVYDCGSKKYICT